MFKKITKSLGVNFRSHIEKIRRQKSKLISKKIDITNQSFSSK